MRLIAALLLCACSGARRPEAPVPSCACHDGAVEEVGVVRGLDELSGLAASRAHPGRLYGHQDSGDRARVFMLDEHGALLGQLTVSGTFALDWEDVAVGRLGDRDLIVVANTGDNAGLRPRYNLVRLAEPEAAGDAVVEAEVLPFTYPDGSHDVEALALDGSTALLIGKVTSGQAPVYTLDWSVPAEQEQTARRLGTLELPTGRGGRVTAADLRRDPCGVRLLVRTLDKLYLYEATGDSSLSALLEHKPRKLPVAPEDQGEAVAWSADGRHYFTGSEGEDQPLHRGTCR